MNQNQSNLDPLILQRLIDGELQTEQVQQILAQAQSAPQQWETIAVGFIENQAWHRALNSQFADRNADDITEQLLDSELESETSPKHSLASDKRENQKQLKRERGPWWVIAASLLAAAAIGYMTNQIVNRSLPVNSIAEKESQSRSGAPLTPELTAADLIPDFHVEVPQDSRFAIQGNDSANRVPVYRVTNTDQLKQFQAQREIESAFPRSVVEQLSNSGYQIEQEIEFVSGEFDDQSFVVPLRTIRFIPGQ